MDSRRAAALLALVLLALALSGIGPRDRLTWLLEVSPVLIGAPILVFTWRRFPLTPLTCSLLALHALILVVGGHWTYAEVPLGFELRDLLHLDRNPYDRIGHFAQGFVPAILAREILVRTSPLRPGGWLFFLVTCVCLAFSAFYELIEWMAALFSVEASESFLGTQGYAWDTQSDMAWAMFGAILALLLLSRVHDRQLRARPWLSAASPSRGSNT